MFQKKKTETVEQRTRNVWYEQNTMSECKIVIHVDSRGKQKQQQQADKRNAH